eukprot:460981-Pyramimonas_sp.AAC.1
MQRPAGGQPGGTARGAKEQKVETQTEGAAERATFCWMKRVEGQWRERRGHVGAGAIHVRGGGICWVPERGGLQPDTCGGVHKVEVCACGRPMA